MSAQNYSMLLPGRKQGNVLVQRTATVELEVLLYNNPIIKYRSVTDRDGHVTKTIVLDACDKPTQTTAKAMNRGLEQLEWPGRVTHEGYRLYYTSEHGNRFLLEAPLDLSNLGVFQFYDSVFMKPGEALVLELQEVA